MEKKTRNRASKYEQMVTFRINGETLEKFKEVCKYKGKKYNEVIRELIDYYLRQNN